MKQPLERVSGRIPVAVTEAAFDAQMLAKLDARFAATRDWVRHDQNFYRCFIAEADDALPDSIQTGLRDAVGAALGLPLAATVRITVQRMTTGDGADRHTDRPLVGYEAARFILQLDTPRGGCFRLLEAEGQGRAWLQRPAVRNQALAFELCTDADHDVTPCVDARRTLVVHFWHRANPPHARDLVHQWLAPMSFASLPSVLDPLIAEADANFDDRVTGVAGRVAWLIGQWGGTPADVSEAFIRVLKGALAGTEAEARARFIVELALDSFDRSTFEALPVSSQRWWFSALSSMNVERF
ncbi:MAG: hypothetical protein AAGA48_27465 [Myxococcota bacterium]